MKYLKYLLIMFVAIPSIAQWTYKVNPITGKMDIVGYGLTYSTSPFGISYSTNIYAPNGYFGNIQTTTGTFITKTVFLSTTAVVDAHTARLNQLQIDTTTARSNLSSTGTVVDATVVRVNQIQVDTTTMQSLIDTLTLGATGVTYAVFYASMTETQRVAATKLDASSGSIVVPFTIYYASMTELQRIDDSKLSASSGSIVVPFTVFYATATESERIDATKLDASSGAVIDSNLEEITQIRVDTTTLNDLKLSVTSGTILEGNVANVVQMQTDTTTLRANIASTGTAVDVLYKLKLDASSGTTICELLDTKLDDSSGTAIVTLLDTKLAASSGSIVVPYTIFYASMTESERLDKTKLTASSGAVIDNLLLIGHSTVTIYAVFGATDAVAGDLVGLTKSFPINEELTIKNWFIENSEAGNCTIAVSSAGWGELYGRIDGTDVPDALAQLSSSSTALTGWSTNIGREGRLKITVLAAATIKYLTIGIKAWKWSR